MAMRSELPWVWLPVSLYAVSVVAFTLPVCNNPMG